ncbi:MAG TPA: IreB family regulatory phosphoprotein [Firmicutes bacterium]|nr:IreB family regulatory phosphoprotein [Bacillota bacterium]
MTEKDERQDTVLFSPHAPERPARAVLLAVSAALTERGYDPVDQLVGYLLSDDPTYITSHGNARSLIRGLGREELLEEIVRGYLALERGGHAGGKTGD